MVCIPRKADIQSAQLDFFAGLDFSFYANEHNAVYSLAEFAEKGGQGCSDIFCDSAGIEYFVVRDFFRTAIAHGGIPRDNDPLAFYPVDND